MRLHRRPFVLGFLALAVLLLQQGGQVAAWSIRKFPGVPAHHEALAETAARCMPSTKLPLPGCRKNYVVNPAFFVGEARRGALEPDLDPPLGDGPDDSRHSLNPRFNLDGMATPILQTYGYPRGILGEGLAPAAINELTDRVKGSLAAMSCSSTPTPEALQILWTDMGRLSHYIADVNSPFHANSFRANENIPNHDYHEGMLVGNRWMRGLWDLGLVGRGGHAGLEIVMGVGANIASASCNASSETDPNVMAGAAASVMDSYSSGVGNGTGYAALVTDLFVSTGLPQGAVDIAQVSGWGPGRASAAVGAIRKTWEDIFKDFPNCGGASCDPLLGAQPPGGDNPDDNVSNASNLGPSPAAVDRVLGGFHRLAAKKGKKQLIGWDLISTWAGDRRAGALEESKWLDYSRRLGYRSSDRQYLQDYVASADVAILSTGFSVSASDLLEGAFGEPMMRPQPGEIGPNLLPDHPVLLIPTGGLAGLAQSQQFKSSLEAYVAGGGVAVAFSQQGGSDFSVLPTPSGVPIHAWGWSEDNSCYTRAASVQTFHPILASQSQNLVDSNIDGFFDSIPEESIVLLRRVKNGLPAMFLYPYGEGWVIVSASYDDWGGFNQTGPGARGIIRDVIAWAKKPADLPINLPGSAVTISLQIKNVTPIPAAQAKLILMSPSRDRVISEQVVPVSLGANSSGEVEFSYTFPADAELGIYHLDYELQDAQGVTVQPVAEADSGRIVVARPPTGSPYRAADFSAFVFLPNGEDFFVDEPVVFRYRLINRSPDERTFRVYYDFNHVGSKVLAGEVIVPGDSTLERDIMPTLPAQGGRGRFWIHVFEEGVPVTRPPWDFAAVAGETGNYMLSDGKGYRSVAPVAYPVFPRGASVSLGQPGTLSLSVVNLNEASWGATLRVKTRDGALLEERAVVLPAGGSLDASFSVPAVSDRSQSAVLFTVELERRGRVLFRRDTYLRILQPALRSLPLTPPVWSRTGNTAVTWTVENAGQAASNGSVAAFLYDSNGGVIHWSETRPASLAPEERQTFSFDVPTLPSGSGSLSLVADDGFGKQVGAGAEIQSRVLGFFDLDRPSYPAGASGEVLLRLRNMGTTRESGTATGSIEGVGPLAAQLFDLNPGQGADLRFPFTVPTDAVGGGHPGRVLLSTGRTLVFALPVEKPVLEIAVEDRAYSVAEGIPVTVRNAGGARAAAIVEVTAAGAVLSETLSLVPAAEQTLTLVLPPQLATGVYVLTARAVDTLSSGAEASLRKDVSIGGTSAILTAATDQTAYAQGAPVAVTSTVQNGSVALQGALLHLEVRTARQPGEGESACGPTPDCGVVWERDFSLDLAPGGSGTFSDGFTAPYDIGQYVLSGTVRNAGGALLAAQEGAFQVVEGGLAVSLMTDAAAYRRGTTMQVSGRVLNLGTVPEPDLTLLVEDAEGQLHQQTLSLAPGAGAEYAFQAPATGSALVATLKRGAVALATARRNVSVGVPQISVELRLPDPAVRLASATPGLIEVDEATLEGVTYEDGGELQGVLPFPVTIDGIAYQRFRQSADGFVELAPFFSGLTGSVAACLGGFAGATVLAPFLADLDPSAGGFVGWRSFYALEADRAGHVFPDDTVVFFWDAPAKGDTQRNRLQLLLSRDGLVKLQAGDVVLSAPCQPTGAALGGRIVSTDVAAPFARRLESGVPRDLRGAIQVSNTGTFGTDVTLDYGIAGGSRTQAQVRLEPGESQSVEVRAQLSEPAQFSVELAGDVGDDPPGTVSQSLEPTEGIQLRALDAPEGAPGRLFIPIGVSKTGGIAGPVTVSYELAGHAGPLTVTRSYDIEPGELREDALPFDLAEGSYTLTASADVPVRLDDVTIRVGPTLRLAATAQVASVTDGTLNLSIDAINFGLQDFEGELQIEGGQGSRARVVVFSGEQAHFDVPVSIAGSPAGSLPLAVRFVGFGGDTLAEASLSYQVVGPRVALVSSPAGQTFDPGTNPHLAFGLRNVGDQRADGSFSFEVFDYTRTVTLNLEPGTETEIAFDDFLIEDDVEAKTYRGTYTIEIPGSPSVTGAVNFSVAGIALQVTPSLDRNAYFDGDTAQLTVELSNSRPILGRDYLVRVHYGPFDESRSVTVEGSPLSLVFAIPLTTVTGEPVFLGVGHPDGRSLYINTLAVPKADTLALVQLDQRVYAPGAAVTVTASSAVAGTLSLSAPGFSETLPLQGSTARTFTLPAELPGGSYAVSWSYSANGGRSSSGEVPFDVDGLRVRVFEAVLDRGRYGSGEPIESRLRVNTNRPAAVTLRAFSLDPDGVSALLGEASLSLTPEADLQTINSWSFSSAVAGLHRLVYGLYVGENLLASGGLAFDVGNAAVLGVRTDKADYPSPTEPVGVSVSAFVSGQATLRLEVDGSVVATQDVTGAGIVDLPVALNGLPPGSHELVAVLDGGGYLSRRSTTFATGTSLPDLVVSPPSARQASGSSWKVDVTVTNVGRSDAPATTLDIRDVTGGASTSIGSVAVPALPASASTVVSVNWSVAGAAGTRTVEAVVDPGGSIQEFREDNNRLSGEIEVPKVVVQALAAASYAANVEAALVATVVNLTSNETLEGLSVTGSVARPDGASVALGATAVGLLPPGATASVTTPWAVGRSAPGSHSFTAQLFSGASPLASSAVPFEVTPTYAFSGSVSATPKPPVSGEPVTLSGQIQNQGNVAASGEAVFELLGPGSVVVERHRTTVEVPLDQPVSVSVSVPSLGAIPGEYDLDLRMSVAGQDLPVARTRIQVTGAPLEASFSFDLTPRVLVFVGGRRHGPDDDDRDEDRDRRREDRADQERRREFVEAALRSSGAAVRATSSRSEFGRLFRSGLFNTYVLIAERLVVEPLLADELREAVFRGDGLIVIATNGGDDHSPKDLAEALGARIRSHLPGRLHTVSILNGPLGPPFVVTVPGRASRIELQGADIAAVNGRGATLATTYSFGLGHSTAFGFDLAVPPEDPARPALESLFARAVAFAAPQQSRVAAAGNVLALVMNLQNKSAAAQPLEVTLSLPSGVHLAGVDDGPTDPAAPTWITTVSASGSQTLRFQVVLPDAVAEHGIGSLVRVNGIAIADPPDLLVSVPETTPEALAGVIQDLEALSLAPGERGRQTTAVALLRIAQAFDPQLLELRIRFGAEAAGKLGRIRTADVSPIRARLDRVIAAWERQWYERLIGQSFLRDPASRRRMSIAAPQVPAQPAAEPRTADVAAGRGRY